MPKNQTNSTILIIPFSYKNGNDAVKELRIELVETLHNKEANTGKIISSNHYLPIVKEKYLSEIHENNSFLTIYDSDKFNLEINKQYELRKKKGGRITDEKLKFCFFRQPAFTINFSENNNELPIGYFLFFLQWEDEYNSFDDVHTSLYGNKFLRFSGLKEEKSCDFLFRKAEDTELNPLISFVELFKEAIPTGIFEKFDFLNNKFIQLHLFQKSVQKPNIQLAYEILRYPPKRDENDQFVSDEDKWIPISPQAFMYATSEGAVILDNVDKPKDYTNKYLPAFLLALNQREVFSFLLREMNEMSLEKVNSRQSLQFQKKLIKIRFQQEFYYISQATEISNFFKLFRETLLVDMIIRDVNDSVSSLHDLLEKENQNLKEKSDKKTNMILFFISLLSIFSAVNDSLDLFNVRESMAPVWRLPITLLVLSIVGLWYKFYKVE